MPWRALDAALLLDGGDRVGGVLGGGVHLVEHLLREGLGDAEDLHVRASCLGALLDGERHLLDVTPRGVVEDADLGSFVFSSHF